jgi:hypothetical protein
MFNDIGPDNKRVQLDDSSKEIACLVNHLYGGDDFLVDINNLLTCSRMAHKYDMPKLQRAVDVYVEQLKLSDANVTDCMLVACASVACGNPDPAMHKMMSRCFAFAAGHMEKICSSR